jgi:hypothetical protein
MFSERILCFVVYIRKKKCILDVNVRFLKHDKSFLFFGTCWACIIACCFWLNRWKHAPGCRGKQTGQIILENRPSKRNLLYAGGIGAHGERKKGATKGQAKAEKGIRRRSESKQGETEGKRNRKGKTKGKRNRKRKTGWLLDGLRLGLLRLAAAPKVTPRGAATPP